MKNKFVLALLIICLSAGSSFAAGIADAVLKQWSRSERYGGEDQSVEINITYYSAEYVEALVQSEADKNLWTNDELERYKYNLLRTLNLDENIAFHIDLNVIGSPMYLAPMDRFFKLRIGGKVYDPVDYDKRFNFKLSGRRDGMMWFRRYDEKSGKNLIENLKDIRLSILSHFSLATASRADLMFIWDITKDDPSVLYKGQAADRLELDRLLKRMEQLTNTQRELEGQMKKVDDELGSIGERVEELQK